MSWGGKSGEVLHNSSFDDTRADSQCKSHSFARNECSVIATLGMGSVVLAAVLYHLLSGCSVIQIWVHIVVAWEFGHARTSSAQKH
jgi:hypothetical protein